MNNVESTNSSTEVYECSEWAGGCGRTFGTYEEFADHECTPNSTPGLSMLIEHRLIVNGPVALCQCGKWEYRNDAVADAAIYSIFQREYSFRAPSNRPKMIGETRTVGSDEAARC